MTIEQQLAEAVALEIASAIEPLQRKVADLEARDSEWVKKSEQATGTIAELQRRLSLAEARPVPLDGKNGERGEKGSDGASVMVGHGAPTTGGNHGDVYLDLKTGDIYQCR